MTTRDDIELKKELRLAKLAGIDIHTPLPRVEKPKTTQQEAKPPKPTRRKKIRVPKEKKEVGIAIRQIAEVLKVNYLTVSGWVRKGLLPAYQESWTYIINKEDLKTFLENPPNTVFNAIVKADPKEIKKLIGEDLVLKSFNYEYTASLLGVHHSTVLKWVSERGLQAKNHMVSVESLQDFLRSDYITRVLPNTSKPSNRLRLAGTEVKPLILSSEDND